MKRPRSPSSLHQEEDGFHRDDTSRNSVREEEETTTTEDGELEDHSDGQQEEQPPPPPSKRQRQRRCLDEEQMKDDNNHPNNHDMEDDSDAYYNIYFSDSEDGCFQDADEFRLVVTDILDSSHMKKGGSRRRQQSLSSSQYGRPHPQGQLYTATAAAASPKTTQQPQPQQQQWQPSEQGGILIRAHKEDTTTTIRRDRRHPRRRRRRSYSPSNNYGGDDDDDDQNLRRNVRLVVVGPAKKTQRIMTTTTTTGTTTSSIIHDNDDLGDDSEDEDDNDVEDENNNDDNDAEENEEENRDRMTGHSSGKGTTGSTHAFLRPDPLEHLNRDTWKMVEERVEQHLTRLLNPTMIVPNQNESHEESCDEKNTTTTPPTTTGRTTAMMNPVAAAVQAYFEWLERRKKLTSVDMDVTKRARETVEKVQKEEAKIKGDPRMYQRKLLERAKQENVIVHLGTGYGKTLIALLLIQHVHSQETLITTTTTTTAPADSSQPDGKPSKKKTIFLVPSVALALQHSTTLRANLPYTVATACFQTSHNTDAYRAQLAAADILVATQGALWDLLLHYQDYIALNRYSLFVVDECHYCAGSHAYRLIFQTFYHTLPAKERPHVLGLTASPIINLRERHTEEELQSMVQALQNTMDAVLISADHSEDYESRSQSIMEKVVKYQALGKASLLPSADNLGVLPSRHRELRQLEGLYSQVGPLVVSLYSKVLLRELSRNVFENESPAEFEAVLNHLRAVVQWCEQDSQTMEHQGRTDKLVALESILETEWAAHPTEVVGLVFCHTRIVAVALHHYFRWREEHKGRLGEFYGWGQSVERRRQRRQYCQSNKIVSGLSTIKDDGDDEEPDMFADAEDDPFSASNIDSGEMMVTESSNRDQDESKHNQPLDEVEDRNRAEEMEEDSGSPCGKLRNRVTPKMETPILSTVLVRNVTSIFNSLSIDHSDALDRRTRQWLHINLRVRDVLTKLRRKELNLLFATSVVEEGVDVQACSVVVAFDSIRSTKSYVQMKGRARNQNAKFFVFQDGADSGKATVSLESARNMEGRIRSFIASTTRHAEEISMDSVEEISQPSRLSDEILRTLEPEVTAVHQGFYKGNYGTVDIQSAKALLTRYCLSIPLDPQVRLSREALMLHMPDFRDNTLVLPSHLPRNIRVITVPVEYMDKPKRDKQRILSLMACVRLHRNGLLNDRLLPLSQKDFHSHIIRATKREFPPIKPLALPLELLFDTHRSSRTIFVRTITFDGELFLHAERLMKGEGHKFALITVADPLLNLPSFSMDHKEFGMVQVHYGDSIPKTCDDEQFQVLRDFFLLVMDERWRRSSRQKPFKLCDKEEFTSVIMPYLLGLLGRDNQLDWDFMKHLLIESRRTDDERTAAVQCLSKEHGLAKPRLWIGTIDEHTKYVAYGPAGETVTAPFPVEKPGISTYQDYFEQVRGTVIASDVYLFDVQRYWALPSSFSSLSASDPEYEPTIKVADCRYTMCDQLSAIKIPQSVAKEARIANAHIGLLSCFLPQAAFVFERYLSGQAFFRFCEINLPKLGSYLGQLPMETVATALTSKSCGMDVSYEKLEWFGDAVLKVIQTESLLKSIELKEWIQFLHEGDLSILRQEMGSNERLERVCQNLKIGQYIMSIGLARGQWLPSLLDAGEGTFLPSRAESRSKIFADVIESILGLVYLEFGYDAAFDVGDELQLTVARHDEPLAEDSVDPAMSNAQLLDIISRTTGYSSMRRTELMEEAFTHASYGNPNLSSYERLEWTGDAVLSLAARRWIWNNFADMGLDRMVTMEGAIVSNGVLAFVASQSGLHHFLHHKDPTLPTRIEGYICSVRQDGRGLWGTDPPKAIADIVESLIGAIYMDGGIQAGLEAAVALLRPVLEVISNCRGEIDLEHPKKRLQEMAGSLLVVDTMWEDTFPEDVPLVDGSLWRYADPYGTHAIGYVHFMDKILVAVADPSRAVARNKACAVMVQILASKTALQHQLHDLRSSVERVTNHQSHVPSSAE